MFESKQFEALAKKLYDTLPMSLQNLENDVQQKFQEILKSAFAKMDLVTREEFDVQAKVLLRTREKMEALQAQVDALIHNASSSTQQSPSSKKL